jgi:hypothetical protein
MTSCVANKNKEPSTLEFYKKFGKFTDPGSNAGLYKNLPVELPDLCKLIKAQMIHPDADMPLYRKEVPAERINEDSLYPDVRSILNGLLSYNPSGLVPDRKPDQRLIVTCRYHALLLASILKSRGIPVRLRYGYAVYLLPGYHTCHVVCEVWKAGESRWILVDPDRQIVDIPPGMFEFAGDVWLQYVKGGIKPEIYGVPGWYGVQPVYSYLCHDIASVMGEEYVNQDHPAFCSTPYMVNNASSKQKDVLSKMAVLLKDVDRNFNRIKSMYEKNGFLHFSIK